MPGGDDKRKAILDAAVRVFARQGYDASPVGDVAKEAGVAYGLVYHYFGSKEAVLRTWRDDPDLVRLLVREITRSPHIQDELDEIGPAFASLERIIRRGPEEG